MHGSSGCLGSPNKHNLMPMVDKSSRGRKNQSQPVKKIQSQPVKKPSFSEDFWTASTCDMDNSAVQSQGSISSISTSNQIVDAAGSASTPPEFGLLLWNQTRQRWTGNKKVAKQEQQVREPKLSWNATYESLLGSNKPFLQAIPLPEMVDFLVDVWEQEGMYD